MGSRNVYQAMLASGRTLFNLGALMSLTGNYDRVSLVRSLYYYRKQGLVRSPRSGLYSLGEYSPKELGCGIFDPSYISLSTVLAERGVSFQYSSAVTVVCAVSRNLRIDGRDYVFRRIDPVLWGAFRGIEQKDGYCIACPERAVLDTMYLFPGICYFDNVSALNPELIMDLCSDYKDIALEKRVASWIKTNMSSL